MQDHIQFAKLWPSFRRWYSVNKDMLIENLHEKTVVALRTVHDSISTLEDHFTKLALTPAMKRHVMSARMRYVQYLDEQKRESLNEQQRKKSKVDTSIDMLLLFAFQSMFISIWVSRLEIAEFPDSVHMSDGISVVR